MNNMDSNPPNQHNPNVCQPIKAVIYPCTLCRAPFESYQKMNSHRGMCRRKYNLNTANLTRSQLHETSDISWGGSNDPTDSMPEKTAEQWHGILEDPTASIARIHHERSEPQEEALGYDNTVLLSAISLSGSGRKAIDLDHQANKNTDHTSNNTMVQTPDHESDQDSSGEASFLFRHLYASDNDEDDEVSSDDDDSLFLPEDHEEEVHQESPEVTSELDEQDDGSWGSYKSCDHEGLEFAEKMPYIDGSMPLLYVAFTDLLWRLDHHKCDLNLFDEIIDWVTHFSAEEPMLFTKITKSTKTTRYSMLKYLRTFFKRDDLQPEIKDIKLPSGTLVTIPQFNFRALATDMLTNPDLMDEANLVKHNFDAKTFKPIIPVHEYIQSKLPPQPSLQTLELTRESRILQQVPMPVLNEESIGRKFELLSLYTLPDDEQCRYWDCCEILEVVQTTNIFTKVKVKWEANERLNSNVSRSTIELKHTMWNGTNVNSWRIPLSDTIHWPCIPVVNMQSIPVITTRSIGKKIEFLSLYTLPNRENSKHWDVGKILDVVKNTDTYVRVKVEWEANEIVHSKMSQSNVNLKHQMWNGIDENSWRMASVRTIIDENRTMDNDANNHVTLDNDQNTVTLPVPSIDFVDDVYSGVAMTKAVDRFIGPLLPAGIDIVRPLGTIFFIDKSHTDLFGALAVTPLSFTFAPFNVESRRKHIFWRNLTFVPPLHVGKGKNAGKLDLNVHVNEALTKRNKGDTKKSSPVTKLTDFHALLKEALTSFHNCCKTGILVTENGIRILYKPFVLMVIGDTAGNNELACHFNSSGNSAINCLMYECKCSFADLPKVPTQCELITSQDIKMSLTDEAYAKSISQHPVKSAFSHLALALRDGGINQSLPKEALHVFCVGHYITLVIIVHDLIGKKGKNAKHKDLLDMLFQRVQSEVKRGSCRDHPISSSHFGVMDKSRATGEQRKGNMHVLLLCVNTFQGIELLKPFLERAGITISEMSNAISLLLAYDQWTSGRCIPRVEVENAMPAVEELVTSLQHALPKRVVKKKGGQRNRKKGREHPPPINQSNGLFPIVKPHIHKLSMTPILMKTMSQGPMDGILQKLMPYFIFPGIFKILDLVHVLMELRENNITLSL